MPEVTESASETPYGIPRTYVERAAELVTKHCYPDRMRLEDFVLGPWQRHVETISPRTAEARGLFIRRMLNRVHVEVLPSLAYGLSEVERTPLCRMPARAKPKGHRGPSAA